MAVTRSVTRSRKKRGRSNDKAVRDEVEVKRPKVGITGLHAVARACVCVETAAAVNLLRRKQASEKLDTLLMAAKLMPTDAHDMWVSLENLAGAARAAAEKGLALEPAGVDMPIDTSNAGGLYDGSGGGSAAANRAGLGGAKPLSASSHVALAPTTVDDEWAWLEKKADAAAKKSQQQQRLSQPYDRMPEERRAQEPAGVDMPIHTSNAGGLYDGSGGRSAAANCTGLGGAKPLSASTRVAVTVAEAACQDDIDADLSPEVEQELRVAHDDLLALRHKLPTDVTGCWDGLLNRNQGGGAYEMAKRAGHIAEQREIFEEVKLRSRRVRASFRAEVEGPGAEAHERLAEAMGEDERYPTARKSLDSKIQEWQREDFAAACGGQSGRAKRAENLQGEARADDEGASAEAGVHTGGVDPLSGFLEAGVRTGGVDPLSGFLGTEDGAKSEINNGDSCYTSSTGSTDGDFSDVSPERVRQPQPSPASSVQTGKRRAEGGDGNEGHGVKRARQ